MKKKALTVKQMFPQRVYTSPDEAVAKCLRVIMAPRQPKQAAKPSKHGRK